ncbi:FtsX-like permease family protein [Aggregatimonas sangjinii]|uniref:FtsX-like permease family protein n=1 Tax=Aggregatimonas sangjinii TaxID=2583587 RepID=A0A5B7SP99_9FLAO|nr:ABC transporter permease [Aggregatimonas sangjinii]QCW98820.1 FtsX-like permease family protein [Aggregatimonas sangjinii]
MFRNSLKVALRGFIRNRMFTGFNLLSLVIGLLVSYVAIGYIGFEYSYDTFHDGSENIYRLARTYRGQDYSVIGFKNDATAADQVAQMDEFKNIPGVEHAAQFIISNNAEYLKWNNDSIPENDFLTTNTPADFVGLFTWKPLHGSLSDFGNGINKMILTESSAQKVFGTAMERPDKLIGEAISVGDESYRLVAIIEDVPENSHFSFSVALNTPEIEYWGSRIYFGIADTANYADMKSRINAAMASINPRMVNDPLYKRDFLQPLEDIHLKSNILYETKVPGNYQYIMILGFFALFIIAITLFNYTNFTVAVKSKHGKSIGIKKAMGAKNNAIALQFFVEGIFLAVLALPIVAILIPLLIPFFNDQMGVAINVQLFDDVKTLLFLVLLAVFLGAFASITPAVLFSRKKALTLFKENLKANRFEHFSLRKYLLVSQFVILISISSVSYFVMRQMDFIENKDLGFQKEGILYAYTSPENLDFFQEQLRLAPEIKNVGNGSSFGIETFNKATYRLQDSQEVFGDANQLYLDYRALQAYDLETTLGTLSSERVLNGERVTLINRTAAERFSKLKNIPMADLIGTTVITEPEYISEEGQVGFPFTIGGIFEDVNVFSLREKLEPYFITVSPRVRMGGMSIVSFDPENTAQVVDKINSLHAELREPYPLEIEFLSQNLKTLYNQDRQTANLVFWLNCIAVLLAVLGIIGITLFLVISRTKEIGIRKVLGASELSIIKSTIREYVLFIAIALVISWPLGLFISTNWLSNFAYRIDIQQVVFLAVGVLTFIFTALLVGAVAFRAARANPAKSLRTE